jgi:hypothetical protein
LAAPAAQLSTQEQATLVAKKYALRQQMAAVTRNDLHGLSGLPEVVERGVDD